MAAGLGFKDFTTGEVLTAADVDGYLMQGIWVFANAAARDAAVTSPQEGNACYLKDTDVIQVYTGSAWAAQSASNPISANIVDAKGDLIVGTAADTVARLAVGANATVLTADSSTATGLKWAAAASSSQILQIVQSTYSTETASTTSSLADTGLTATITPTSASNKILVLCTQAGLGKTATSATDNAVTIYLNRGGSDIQKITGYAAYTATNLEVNIGNTSISYLDAPATTSATEYKTRFRREGTGGSAKVQIDSSVSVMTLLEISGV